jgi:hypothetical protein
MDDVATRTVVMVREDPAIDSRLRAAVFRHKKPLPEEPRIGTVVTEDSKYAVYSVTGFAPGRPESVPLAERDAGKLQLGQQSGSRDLTALILDLERRADIVKSADVLAQETPFE